MNIPTAIPPAKHNPIPTAWDFFFKKQGAACFVLAHLTSGKMIGGFYGTNSYTSEYPEQPEIYLEETWQIDETGKFLFKISGTLGAIVRFDECSVIEFLEVGSDEVKV